MRVAVTGSTGFIGSALVEALLDRGDEVVRVVRGGGAGVRWDPARGAIEAGALEGVDAVVHLAGHTIGRRYTRAQKQRVLGSRIDGTTLIARTIAGMTRAPRVLVSASAVGYYGDRGAQILDEGSGPGSGFLADVCRQWEAAAEPARAAGVRVAHIRTGLVLHPSGGLLARLLLPFRLGLGARLGDGMQYQPWITREDEVRAILHLIDTDGAAGPFNLTAPSPVTNAELTRALARALRRPALLVVPRFAIATVLGRELTADLLASQRALPRALDASGFSFRSSEVEAALQGLLSGSG